MLSTSALGTDGSLNSSEWGHGSQAFAASIPDAAIKLRWQGATSGHARITNFESTVLGKFQTNAGDFSGIASSFTPLAGHNANAPANSNIFNTGVSDTSVTDRPFIAAGASHWAINTGGYRWEVDDFPNSNANSTIHRIWVKPQ